ncbi:MAG TPA: two-component sensor histidine kinase [Firmicutes bacterium]|nr:two-component sensor histidine kinase [Bacillota bacterium]
MINSKHEIYAVYVLCTILILISLSKDQNNVVSVLFLIIMFILVTLEHTRKLQYIKKMNEYEEVARDYHEEGVIKQVAPLILDQEEVIGVQFNRLMRYIEQQERNNNRSMQIISIITNHIETPIVILNANGEIEYANNRFREWSHLSILKPVSFKKIKNASLRNVLEDALICETSRNKSLEIFDKHYVSVANPIFNDEQAFNGTVLIFYDITDIKKYDNLQKEFFANASHELKTPISAIKGCTEILINGAKEDPQALEEFLSMIQVENERMEKLVKNLLLINRFEYDQIVMKTNDVDLNELLVDCVVQALNFANTKGQKIRVNAALEYTVQGDIGQLKHCFGNLLANAIHYSSENTVIQINVSESEDCIIIDIIDEGIGIPKADLPHVFERFYRVDKGRSRNTGGTGLGLSLVQSIVEAHKGKVTVKSELNVGSTFTISLPKT